MHTTHLLKFLSLPFGFLKSQEHSKTKLVIVKKIDAFWFRWGEKMLKKDKQMALQTYGRDWKKENKSWWNLCGGERTFWKVFKRWQCVHMHEKITKKQ
jgi:hypothetical protein